MLGLEVYTGFPDLVRRELDRARTKHPAAMNSWHEGYAVLLEEVEELWAEIKKQGPRRSRLALLDELTQVAAMAQRLAEDVGGVTREEDLETWSER